MLNNKGFFISFEGIDGSGKSTQINNIKQKLKNKTKRDIVYTREPGGTTEAENIRKILLNPDIKLNYAKTTEILLLVASRYEHYNNLIEPSIELGKVVICDRYSDSTLAYQCHQNKKLKKFFLTLSKSLLNNAIPNLTILLDLHPEDALKRINKRVSKNKYDKKALDFYKNVRREYIHLAKKNNRIKVFDATLNEKILTQNIMDTIIKKIN